MEPISIKTRAAFVFLLSISIERDRDKLNELADWIEKQAKFRGNRAGGSTEEDQLKLLYQWAADKLRAREWTVDQIIRAIKKEIDNA